MQQVRNHGLSLKGVWKGILENRRTNNDGQAYVQHFGGIEVPKMNGFPGETEVIRVQVPKDLVSQGIMGKTSSLIDKQVECFIWVRAYPTRAGAGYGYYLENNIDCVQLLNGQSELKKAS